MTAYLVARMATTTGRIVPAAESDIHDEPHIEGRRITVQFVHEQVEGRGLDARTVADEHDLDVADVYRALAYYHDHPEEMARVERVRERAVEDNASLTTDPDSVHE